VGQAKTQQLLFPSNFPAASDWPKLGQNLTTTLSVICSRFKRGGLRNPSEITVKNIAGLVACLHWPEGAPDPEQAFEIVKDIKRLLHTPFDPLAPRLDTWPDQPSALPPQVLESMYDPEDPPEPRHMDRASYMCGKIPLRKTSKTLANVLPTSDLSLRPPAASGVLQLLQMFAASCRPPCPGADGYRQPTPGPRIEEVQPPGAADSLAVRGASGAAGVAPSAAPGASTVAGGGVAVVLGGGAAGGVPATPAPLTSGDLNADAAVAAALDAVKQMEAEAAGSKTGSKTKKAGRPPKKDRPEAKVKPPAAKAKLPAALAKKPAGKRPANPRKTPEYQDFYQATLKALLKKKKGMAEAHALTRTAAEKKFKL